MGTFSVNDLSEASRFAVRMRIHIIDDVTHNGVSRIARVVGMSDILQTLRKFHKTDEKCETGARFEPALFWFGNWSAKCSAIQSLLKPPNLRYLYANHKNIVVYMYISNPDPNPNPNPRPKPNPVPLLPLSPVPLCH